MHATLRHLDPLRALDAVFEWDLVLLEDEAQTPEDGLRVDAVPVVRADADLRVAGDGRRLIRRARRRAGAARLPRRVPPGDVDFCDGDELLLVLQDLARHYEGARPRGEEEGGVMDVLGRV